MSLICALWTPRSSADYVFTPNKKHGAVRNRLIDQIYPVKLRAPSWRHFSYTWISYYWYSRYESMCTLNPKIERRLRFYAKLKTWRGQESSNWPNISCIASRSLTVALLLYCARFPILIKNIYSGLGMSLIYFYAKYILYSFVASYLTSDIMVYYIWVCLLWGGSL